MEHVTARSITILAINIGITIGSWLMTLSDGWINLGPLQIGGLIILLCNTVASWLNKSPDNPLKNYAIKINPEKKVNGPL